MIGRFSSASEPNGASSGVRLGGIMGMNMNMGLGTIKKNIGAVGGALGAVGGGKLKILCALSAI
jgi:hypothetical protein